MTSDLTAATAWASATRTERDAFVAQITAARLAVSDVASLTVDASEAISTLRLLPCVEAMPIAGGKVKSRRAIAAAGLDEGALLGEISEAEWSALAKRVGDDARSATTALQE